MLLNCKVLVLVDGIPHSLFRTLPGFSNERPGVFQRALAELKSLQGSLGDFVGAVFSLTQYKSAINCALNTGRSGVVKTAFRI